MHHRNKLLVFLSYFAIFTFIVISPLSAQEETPEAETTVNEEVPTEQPPVEEPTEVPAEVATEVPTEVPTDEPTVEATEVPTDVPTDEPTVEATEVPTDVPTDVPTVEATDEPTVEATEIPTEAPVLVAPVFNLAQTSYETTAGLSLVIDVSVSDDNGIVRVVEDASATLGGVSVSAASEASESESGYSTAVSVTYLAPAEYAGSDSFSLTAVDMTGESASVVISVNVLAVAAEVTETPAEEVILEVPEDTVQAAMIYTVNSTADDSDLNTADGLCDVDDVTAGSQCTLRAAIEQANANVGTDTIKFALASPFIIAPGSELPTITEPVIITGTLGKVVLDGTSTVDSGLILGAGSDGSKISGMVINNFVLSAIEVLDSDGNTISGNYIGVAANGTTPAGNGAAGIFLNASSNNVIGGNSASTRNIISGNNPGVALENGSNNNTISSNYIGTDKTGKVAIPNDAGVSLDDASSNTIGGDAAGERNLISGNSGNGVAITGDSANNIISANYIGVDVSGKLGLGNDGAGVMDSTLGGGTLIGGDAVNERNIISGNGGNGVTLESDGATVSGNYIGTDVTGKVAIGNGDNGVALIGDSHLVGGDVAGERNILSGNTTNGVGIGGDNNTVSGNYIGTDTTGTKAIPNSLHGVGIIGDTNMIGGDVAGERNIISGNVNYGVGLGGNSNTVSGNYIGTTTAGNKALPNQTGGVLIQGQTNMIGGGTTGERNLISGNLGTGVSVDGGDNNTISGNYIGTDVLGKKALGNLGSGVFFGNTATDNLAGGADIAQGNLIAFNSEGVVVSNSDSDVISHNSIFNNVGLGISLDGGTGNNDIAGPTIATVTATQIDGEFPAFVGDPYRVEVFSSATCDSSGSGEGQTFLGQVDINPTATDPQPFSLTLTTALNSGVYITANITNTATSNTSEFSECVVFSTTAPTAKPRLFAPTNNSIFFSGAFIDFSWGSIPLADMYTLEIATDKLFSNIVHTEDILIATTEFGFDAVSELGDVLDDGDYYWRVRGVNVVGSGPYSNAFKFTVNANTGPILVKPLNNSFTSDNTPTFSWKKLAGAASYSVSWIDDGSTDCADIQLNGVSEFPTKTSFTPTSGQELSEGTITWCVQAFDNQFNGSAFSQVFTFDLTLLKAPRDNSFTTDTTPTFSWNKAPGTGVTYRLEVDDEPTFSAPLLIDQPGLTKTSFTPTAANALPNSDGYFWRVTVTGGSWTVTDQTVWEFFIAPAKLVAPVLVTPTNGNKTVDAATLMLDWNAVAAIAGVNIEYEIWVDTSPKFNNVQLFSSATDDFDLSGQLNPGTRYYWKVRAVYTSPSGAVAYGPFSKTFNFTTIP